MGPTDGLTSLDDALARLLPQAGPVAGTETRPLRQALGRILASDQTVPADVPPADNSAVDGYAVRVADLAGQPLPVSQRIPAGVAPEPLTPGTAARIFTGASVPDGADAVLMQENVSVDDAGLQTAQQPEIGQNIRPRGQDLKAGSVALPAGTRLRPQELGLLASLGIAEVPVYRPVRVAILTTGDELVPPGEPLPPGKIYNTNRFTLDALLQQMHCDVVDLGDVADTREATTEALKQASREADLILSSGGVSVGEEDHVRAAMEALGDVALWRLALKPGKPLAFGHVGDTPMLGLPGNPAAVLVTFLVVAAPFIRRLQGAADRHPAYPHLPADFTVHRPSPRREFVRARRVLREGRAWIEAHPNQSSGMLSSACWAEGLAVVPEDTMVNRGDPLTFLSFTDLLG
ncbi:molybdopterin molybdenumtransferase MoeA [Marinobacter halodurans]|uniref:Molybdopterin molybdenumtransferase n=1 Tax=Marinobacter halodurans TaxID=2528979 RepID=A0ABY1ZQR0_9GAMM|nr:gephyrin-like molybdotransferase Glp [Marinobacter halodurans]TBW58199.1 molybdopterin molybdenumtransferase MoeA [Marinobacter halodurans]